MKNLTVLFTFWNFYGIIILGGYPLDKFEFDGGNTMAFFPPIPLIRRKKACGAISVETAKTLTEAGVINPNGFKRITDKLVETNVIHKTADGKYYL